MSDVALVHNRNSTGNLRMSPGRRGSLPAAVRTIDCSSLEELSLSLEDARSAGAEIVLIDGGDGTVREVLTRLPAIWGPKLPHVGIIPRGNTNLIAREVGGLRADDAVLEILRRRESGSPLPVRRRRVLRVDYPDAEHPSLRGFMLGWGAYATATRIARDQMKARGPWQVALTVLSTVRRAIVGGDRAELRRGVATRLSVDGREPSEAPRFIGLMTTLRGPLVAGINPFWGEGEQPIRWLDVLAPARGLACAVPFVLSGRPRRWMAEAGYDSGRASRVELSIEAPFIMDGDLFPAARGGPLRITAGEEVAFISL